MVKDLPIGASPDGFEAWVWQDLLASGVAMGAPPDLFNTQGQNWGLPPLVPHKLRAARYEPFIDIVRAGLRHAGGLRIDHVIGLFRSFWVPNGFGAQEGAYVRYPVDDLLAILALESQRAGALIIGEDLGTVEPGTRSGWWLTTFCRMHCCISNRPGRAIIHARRWPRSPPTTCRPWPVCGVAAIWQSKTGWACSPTPAKSARCGSASSV